MCWFSLIDQLIFKVGVGVMICRVWPHSLAKGPEPSDGISVLVAVTEQSGDRTKFWGGGKGGRGLDYGWWKGKQKVKFGMLDPQL